MDLWASYDYDAKDYLFTAPGRYEVCVGVKAYPAYEGSPPPSSLVESNTVAVAVSEADTASPALYWTAPPFATMLTAGLDPLSTFIQDGPRYYADSKWWAYASYALAQDIKRPVPERVALLTPATAPAAPAQLQDPALLLLADLLLQQKDYAGCRAQAEKVTHLLAAPSWARDKATALIAKVDRLTSPLPK